MSVRGYVIFFLIAAAVVGVTTVKLVSSQDAPAPVQAVPHFQHDEVRVRITADAQVSRGQDPMLVQFESGTIASGVTHLMVLTDENCQPDADGVSHCLNRVQFATQTGLQEATLRHHHRMSEEPCLAPGQMVELVS